MRAAGTPLNPPRPVAFCSAECAKGKINNHQGRGGQGQGFEFLEMKFPYGAKGPSAFTSCAWRCGKLAEDSREGEGLGDDRDGRVLRKEGTSGELWGHLWGWEGQARTWYCTKFSSWENSELGHQGS